jgi:tetratricopeptide (TPR) repeat protein
LNRKSSPFNSPAQTFILVATIHFPASALKHKNAKKHKVSGSSQSRYVSLASLGDELRRKNPDMMKKVEALHGTKSSFTRIMEAIYDLLPYPWDDLESFEQGGEQIFAGRFSEAVESFKTLLQQFPDCYPALHLMGLAYGCKQKYKEEIDCYRRAVKIRPDYPQVYFDLAMSYWFQGKEKRAFSEFKRGVPLAPDFATADFWLHFTIERLKRVKSVGKSNENTEEQSNKAIAHGCFLLGIGYLEHGLHIAARHAFKKAVHLLPDFAEAQFELGSIHIKRLRNPKRAEKYLERAEQLFLTQGDLQRAILAHQLCRPGEKVADSARAADDWLKEGLRLQQLERYQGAIDAYKMAIKYQPNFVDAFYNLGIAYGSLEDSGVELIHKAIWAFKQVIKIKPDYIYAYSALGASYIKQGEYGEALATLTSALRLQQKESQIYYYLGMVSRLTENNQGAVEYLQEAVALNPNSVQSNFYLGLTLMELERFPEACEVFQEVVHTKPDFAEVHFMLGNIYMDKMGDTDKAVAHLKKAEKLFIKLDDNLRLSHVRQMLAQESV